MNLIVISYYFPPDLGAGAFRMGALAELIDKDPDVNLTVLCAKPNRYKQSAKFKRSDNACVKTFWVPAHNSSIISQAIGYSFFFIQALIYSIFIPRKSIIFGTSSRFFTMFLSYLISKLRRGKLVIDLRDIFSESLESNFGNNQSFIFRKIIRLLFYIECKCLNHAKKLFQVSPAFKKYFIDSVQGDWIDCLNGIDEIFLKNNKTLVKEKDHITLLYAGNIGIAQSLSSIIPQAAKNLPGHKFRIIGDGTDLENLKSEIHYRNICNVNLLPPVSRDKLVKEYENADILFLHLKDVPAFKRVIPSKIFEYGAFNKPICAGTSGLSKEFLEKNISNIFFFEQHSSSSLVDTLQKIKLDEENIYFDNFINKYSRKSQMNLMITHLKSLG